MPEASRAVKALPAVVLAAIGAAIFGCNAEAVAHDPLLCGFDGDASPGYQEVALYAFPQDASGEVTSAPAGSTLQVISLVYANLRASEFDAGSLCNVEVTWEVLAGGGTLSSPTSNTGGEPVPFSGQYQGRVDWTLGPPGVQTLHGYVSDDHSIDTTISLTATEPPPTNAVLFYNNTPDSAYVVGPGESAVAATRVETHGMRQVAIPSAVASQSTFRAYLIPGTVAATITCTVTAAAWTGGGQPTVEFDINGGGHLSCSNGLVGV